MRYTLRVSTNVIEMPGANGRGSGTQQMVADNLNAELARRRISGRKASRDLGITQVYVARRVSGDVELSVSDLMMFSSYLGINPGVLLGTENPHQFPGGGSSGLQERTSD